MKKRGRKPFTMNLNSNIVKKFKKHCDEYGYVVNRRLEVLIKRDMAILFQRKNKTLFNREEFKPIMKSKTVDIEL